MRLTKERVRFMAQAVLDRLVHAHVLEIEPQNHEQVVQALEKTIMDELLVEDRLNAEVRAILQQYQAEFEQGRADYHKMFTMVKQKLIKERGLVL
ncbi:MAG: DUF507 family protein [Nitrospirae bacterium]|nr:MAG: DUF507 family protein [Nitrospirota bacterium]